MGALGARVQGREEGEEKSWKKADYKRAIFLSLGRTCGSYKETHSHPPLLLSLLLFVLMSPTLWLLK